MSYFFGLSPVSRSGWCCYHLSMHNNRKQTQQQLRCSE